MFRIEPNLPSQAYKTYQIVSPASTHFRSATCVEFECKALAKGWKTVIDERTEIGASQAYYIRKESGRRFREDKDLTAGLTIFIFEPGQQCFAEHKVRLDREEFYLTRPGDWRNLGRPYRHTRAELWLEDFQENLDRLKEASDG